MEIYQNLRYRNFHHHKAFFWRKQKVVFDTSAKEFITILVAGCCESEVRMTITEVEIHHTSRESCIVRVTSTLFQFRASKLRIQKFF